jgi:predicted transglutaminase-like cysteine proteinase
MLNPQTPVRSHKKKESTLLILAIIMVLAIAGPVITGGNFRVDRGVLDQAERKYGKDARAVLLAWENLIRQDKSSSDRQKLEKVNRFFNRMLFVDDIRHWRQKDYWATPIEFLASGGGDCEDFSIAKYFTLKAMGVREERLNLSYVKALQYNMHHMVLTYYSTPGAIPLVLDNLIDPIKSASERTDLMPIFSFNGTGLWLAKQRGRGKLAGSSSRVKRWRDLLQKMAENKL